MSSRVLVFAGTTEGREVCERLLGRGIAVTACVATEYGEICLSEISGLQILMGRLSEAEMVTLVGEYDIVIDATHPFATAVSENVQKACERAEKRTFRVVRSDVEVTEKNMRYFENLTAVCSYLSEKDGVILATTGSKELLPYTAIADYGERVYVRVLPTISSLEACTKAGFSPKNIIAMQGPFSEELNFSTLKQLGAGFLVTKESGSNGGLSEKLSAAEKAGAEVLVIGKPRQEIGVTVDELMAYLGEDAKKSPEVVGRFPLFIDIAAKNILVVGGGSIAARRIRTLLSFGGKVTVVAPEISTEISGERGASSNLLQLVHREFSETDLPGMDMVLAATNQRAINHQVYLLCQEKNILVNVCDCKEECGFYFPAIFEGENIIGGLVSKNGEAHGAVKETARKIRQFLRERVANEKN